MDKENISKIRRPPFTILIVLFLCILFFQNCGKLGNSGAPLGILPGQGSTQSGSNPTATPTGFFVGELIQIVNVTSQSPADIWTGPTVQSTFVGHEQLAALGTIIGGPTTDAFGNTWYDVNFADGLSGWDTTTYLGPTP